MRSKPRLSNGNARINIRNVHADTRFQYLRDFYAKCDATYLSPPGRIPESEWNQSARVRAGNFQVAGNRDARPDVTSSVMRNRT